MNAAFRSHLMQQFVSAARHQARAPIALMGWVQHHDDEHQQHQERSSSRSSSSSTRQQLSSIGSTPTSHASRLNMDPSLSRRTGRREGGGNRNMSSTLANSTSSTTSPLEEEDLTNDTEDRASEEEPSGTASKADHRTTPSSELALSFQSLLLTRRTTSKYRTPASEDQQQQDDPTRYGLLPPLLTAEQYRAALDRAVVAGRAAPNHKRTEPFSFRRLLAPSESTERLAEIAEQVYLRQKQVQQQNLNNNNAFDPTVVQAAAQRKREKWRHIPAFLVTFVSTKKRKSEHASRSPPSLISNTNTDDGEQPPNKYDPLPYTPPASERALEDYAAACAATQNILLSLHSEGLASKWATGPVIQTPAFRELLQAEADDRVVALVMIGQVDVTAAAASAKPRRYRRPLEGDVLLDL